MTSTFSSLLLAALLATLPAQAQSDAIPAQIERRPDASLELVRFERATAPPASAAARVLRATLGLGAQTELRPVRRAETDGLGLTRQRYQQFYQGVPVDFTAYTTVARAGKLELLTGQTLPLADNALNVQPTLPAAQALRAALRFVHARRYMWEVAGSEQFARETEGKISFQPTGQLVIVADQLATDQRRVGKPALAWKFDVYAAEPSSRAWIYVDAHTGAVVNQNAISKDAAATATFTTLYSGTRLLANESTFLGYSLWNLTRGQGVFAYNALRSNNLGAAGLFLDANNVWTAAEYNNNNQDWVAGDAFFGAEMTYDYWLAAHGRSSYDGHGAKLKSYVHYNPDPSHIPSWANAQWNGSAMLYGDGDANSMAWTTVDICGHEIGHAVCDSTAGLQYFREPGALNEAFSDIWGACVEARAAGIYGLTGKNTWLFAEEVFTAGGALRSMSNPKACGQPNTYQGVNWVYPSAATDTIDFGGVHRNSGVLNYWFYLVSQGGSGTNDKGKSYAVAGIGIDKAAKIAYLTEQLLTPLSNFWSCWTVSIQAATMLYGANSAEVAAVTNAWHAVGFGGHVSQAISGFYGFIDAVWLGNVIRLSGFDGGYYDYYNQSPSVKRCSAHTLQYSSGTAVATASHYWNVWVDFNRDGDLSDAGEQVVTNRLTTTDNTYSSTFTVPSTAVLGPARMRVSMSNTSGMGPYATFTFGEVEDYTLMIGAALPVAIPANLSATAVTSNSATLSWTAVPNATAYTVQYRSGTGAWLFTSTNVPSMALMGLTGARAYQYKVSASNQCSASAYSAVATFTTLSPTYCTSQGTSTATSPWIDLVQIGAINRASTSDGGYFNGPACLTCGFTVTTVAAGSSQTLSFSAGSTGRALTLNWKVYVDWNNDGDLTDAGETVVSTTTTNGGSYTRTFTVPAMALSSVHRLRLVMSTGTPTACGAYSTGETEDYTLNVTGGAAIALPGQGDGPLAPAPAAIVTGAQQALEPAARAVAFPNPATDLLHLSFAGSDAVPTTVAVYDLRGARVLAATYDGTGLLDVRGLLPGVYTATLHGEAGSAHVRFVKE